MTSKPCSGRCCCLAISAAQMTEVCLTALFRAKELNLTRCRLEMSCDEVKAPRNSVNGFARWSWDLTRDSSTLVPKSHMDASAPMPNCPDILDPSRWYRSVLLPKCLRSEVSVHRLQGQGEDQNIGLNLCTAASSLVRLSSASTFWSWPRPEYWPRSRPKPCNIVLRLNILATASDKAKILTSTWGQSRGQKFGRNRIISAVWAQAVASMSTSIYVI